MNKNNYYGLLEEYKDLAEWAKKDLDSGTKYAMSIQNGVHITNTAEIVEEIVRRRGEFYKAGDAIDIIPFEIKHPEVYVARYKYRDGEIPPRNPAYHEFDWITLSRPQYLYGMYLTNLIKLGKLAIEDLTD